MSWTCCDEDVLLAYSYLQDRVMPQKADGGYGGISSSIRSRDMIRSIHDSNFRSISLAYSYLLTS